MKIDTRTTVITVTIGIAAAAGSAVFWLAGTTGTTAVASASPTESMTAANPVSILQRMHVPTTQGVSDGRIDIYGDRYATGQFADGEQVTVYTYANQQAENSDVARFGPSNDVNKLLIGALFTVHVTGVDTAGGISFPQSPAELSRETGAKEQGQ